MLLLKIAPSTMMTLSVTPKHCSDRNTMSSFREPWGELDALREENTMADKERRAQSHRAVRWKRTPDSEAPRVRSL